MRNDIMLGLVIAILLLMFSLYCIVRSGSRKSWEELDRKIRELERENKDSKR